MTLEEKIDELLRYQKSTRRWNRIKMVINLILVFVLVVLPIWGIIQFFRWSQDNLGFSLQEAQQVLEGLQTVGETKEGLGSSLDELIQDLDKQGSSETLNQIGVDNLNLDQISDDLNVRQEELKEFLEEININQ